MTKKKDAIITNKTKTFHMKTVFSILNFVILTQIVSSSETNRLVNLLGNTYKKNVGELLRLHTNYQESPARTVELYEDCLKEEFIFKNFENGSLTLLSFEHKDYYNYIQQRILIDFRGIEYKMNFDCGFTYSEVKEYFNQQGYIVGSSIPFDNIGVEICKNAIREYLMIDEVGDEFMYDGLICRYQPPKIYGGRNCMNEGFIYISECYNNSEYGGWISFLVIVPVIHLITSNYIGCLIRTKTRNGVEEVEWGCIGNRGYSECQVWGLFFRRFLLIDLFRIIFYLLCNQLPIMINNRFCQNPRTIQVETVLVPSRTETTTYEISAARVAARVETRGAGGASGRLPVKISVKELDDENRRNYERAIELSRRDHLPIAIPIN